MCSHCLAHQELRESFDKILTLLEEPDIRKYDHPYLELTEEIPASLPNGTGIFSPIDWIRWAKKELGYKITNLAG